MSVKELYIMYKIAKSGEDWVSFIKEKYEGGKKKVPNTNPETKDQYSEVSTSTLYKNDENFRNKLQKEFEAWKHHSAPVQDSYKNLESLASLLTGSLSLHLGTLDISNFDTTSLTEKIKSRISEWGFTPEDMLCLFGASAFSSSVVSNKPKINFALKSGKIEVSSLDIKGVLKIKRFISQDSVKNDTVNLTPESPKGLGTKVFASQVYHAKKSGLQYINCEAYRSAVDPNWVGYKVWPKFGYDGELSPPISNSLSTKIKDMFYLLGYEKPYKISHLYSLPDDEGIKWWEENGESIKLSFDLSDNSYSMKTLTKYLEKKASENKKQASILKSDPLLKSFFLRKASDKSFDDFLDEKYDSGKALVTNTYSETKDEFKEVSVSTLLKNDDKYRAKLQKEYEAWKKEDNSSGFSKDDPEINKLSEFFKTEGKSHGFTFKVNKENITKSLEYTDDPEDTIKRLKWFHSYLEEQGVLDTYMDFRSNWQGNSNTPEAMFYHGVLSSMGVPYDKAFLDDKIKKSKNYNALQNPNNPKLLAVKKTIKTVYNLTQAFFKSQDIDKVRVYRAVFDYNGEKDGIGVGSGVEINTRPLSSWTGSAPLAENFCEGQEDFVMGLDVDAKHIFVAPCIDPFFSLDASSLKPLKKDMPKFPKKLFFEDEYVLLGVHGKKGKVLKVTNTHTGPKRERDDGSAKYFSQNNNDTEIKGW